MLGQSETIEEFQNRFPVIYYLVLAMFALLTSRLFYLQQVKGDYFYEFSQKNFLRKERVTGPRGRILDRDGQIMVDNRLQLDITVTPQFLRKPKEVIQRLANLTGLDAEQLYKKFSHEKGPRFQPIHLIRNAEWDWAVRIESDKTQFPGVEVEQVNRRTYVNGEVGAHVFGYLKQVEKKDLLNADYSIRDLIGKDGIEREWEFYLRGEDGARYVEVDAHGHRVQKDKDAVSSPYDFQREVEPRPGHNLVLTVDAEFQKAAYKALQGKMGAVTALDPRTGAVLAMVSNPSYDATELSTNDEYAKSLDLNEFGVWRNKVIRGHYPAGSTFKPFTLLTALEKKLITPNTMIDCPPAIRLGRRLYHDHKRSGFGSISMVEALRGSSNVFMYKLAKQMKVDDLSKVGSSFGLGRRTGIKLPYELTGNMPTEEWAKKRRGTEWTRGETLSASIGQGANLVTPLQLALSYATLVNGGILYRPYLVSRVESADGEILEEFGPEFLGKRPIKASFLEAIKKGLWEVVNHDRGTARRYLKTEEGLISGKTGTSQVITSSREDLFKPCLKKDFDKRHHGWFVGYAPRKNPEIVVAAFAMHECSSKVAAKMSRYVFDAWWAKKKAKKALQGPQPAAGR